MLPFLGPRAASRPWISPLRRLGSELGEREEVDEACRTSASPPPPVPANRALAVPPNCAAVSRRPFRGVPRVGADARSGSKSLPPPTAVKDSASRPQEKKAEDGGLSSLTPGQTQKMIAVGLTTTMDTVRVLVLDSVGPNLDTVVNFLKCFPFLERLYVIFQSGTGMDNTRKYDPLDPIECLELHLKEVVLKNYDGRKSSPSIDFTKFFILNAKVLEEMEITLPYHRMHNWFAKQRRLLQVEDRASRDAQIELACGSKEDFTDNDHTHDLSIADPFSDMPSEECHDCRFDRRFHHA